MQMGPTSLSNLTRTRVFVIESCDEEDRIATSVDLIVYRPLGEKGALTFGQGVLDEPSAVLFNESGFDLSVHEVKDFGRSGVSMGGVHTAWPIPFC